MTDESSPSNLPFPVLLDWAEQRLDGAGRAEARDVLPHLEALSGTDAEAEPRYWLNRGLALYLVDRDDEGRVDLEAAYERAAADDPLRGWACVRLARLHLWHKRMEEACGWIDIADGLAPWPGDPRLAGEVSLVKAMTLTEPAHRAVALQHLAEAELIFAKLKIPHRLANVLVHRAGHLLGLDMPKDEVIGQVERLLQAAAASGVSEEELVGDLMDTAVMYWLAGRRAGVEPLVRYVVSGPLERHIPVKVRPHLAKVLLDLGEEQAAREQCTQTLDALDADDDLRKLARLNLVVLAFRTQNLGARDDLIQVARDVRAEVDDPWLMLRASKHLMDGGAPQEARALLEELLAIMDLDYDLRSYAHLNLSGALCTLGQMDAAAEALEKVSPDLLERDKESHGVWCQNRAVLAEMRGADDEARRLFEHAVGLFREVGDNIQLAMALAMAAELAYRRDDYTVAWAWLTDALDLKHVPPAIHCRIYWTVGRVMQEVDAPEDAHDWFSEGIETARQAGDLAFEVLFEIGLARLLNLTDQPRAFSALLRHPGCTPHLVTVIQWQMAIVHVELEDEGAAKRNFLRAARGFQHAGRLVDAAEAFFIASMFEENPDKEERLILRALRTAHVALGSVRGEYVRLEVRQRIRPIGTRLVELLLRRKDVTGAFLAAIQIKAGEFLRLQRAAATRMPGSLRPDVVKALERASRAALAEDINKPSGFAMMRAELEADAGHPTRVSPVQLFEVLTRSGGAAGEVRIRPERILKKLQGRHAAVEYLLTDEGRLHIFVLHRDRVRHILRRWRRQHRRALRMVCDVIQGRLFGGDPADLMRMLQDLQEVLIKPLGSLPDRVELLDVAPGGQLARVPFAALVDAEGRTLLDRTMLRYQLTTAQLALLPRRRTRIRRAMLLRGDDGQQEALPHATGEDRVVRAMLVRKGISVVSAGDDRALETVDLLHYAGHAHFEPGVKGSATLYLPGKAVRAPELTGLELRRKPVVVLSACESGHGATWGDEMGGFMRAFFAAGASSVVSSSWLAHDQGTAELMEFFYEHLLAGASPANALHHATRAVRSSGGDRAHPFYWANFRCYGV